jgi:TatD DNase family protein
MPRFLELGFSIAFSGSVTRPNARRYAETAAAVPLDRFLLETDAPSIATATRRASEVEPCHIVEIANKSLILDASPLPGL